MQHVVLFSALEAYISIICACLPRVYILITRLYRKYRSTTKPRSPTPTHPMAMTLPHIEQGDTFVPKIGPGNTNQTANSAPARIVTEVESSEQEEPRLRGYSNATSSDFTHPGEGQSWTSETPCTRPASV